MKRFKDHKLAVKQGVVFAFILVLMGGVSVFLMYRMTVLKAQIDIVTSQWLPGAVESASIKSSASDLRNMQLQQAIAHDDSTRRRLASVMIDLIDRIEDSRDVYESLINTPEQVAIHQRFEEKWERYQDISFVFFSLVHEGKQDDAVALLTGDAEVAFNSFSAVLDTLVSVNESASTKAAFRAAEMYNRARRISRIVLGVAVLVALILATVLVRLITTPVTHLAQAARTIAGGNINVELDVMANDEIGDLSRSFNQMTESLRKARDEILKQQARLREANVELEDKNRDLEAAMKQVQQTQQQLVMHEKMASLGSLVAGVAHEINNPIGAVKSAVDTSARSVRVIETALDEERDCEAVKANRRFQAAMGALRSNIDVTTTASNRIANIVKGLKNFARLDEAEFQEADIHEGLDSTLTLLDHEIRGRVDVIKDYGRLPRVRCYASQLNQVFMNVLSNAQWAIEGRGTIRVTTRSEGNAVTIVISDDGRGIDPDKLPRIFDPGFTTKGVGVGTGLGLSTAYTVVERHNGTITAESEPGRGTTVTITIPST